MLKSKNLTQVFFAITRFIIVNTIFLTKMRLDYCRKNVTKSGLERLIILYLCPL